MSVKKNAKIAYIGGGSRLWARKLMSDLALAEAGSGTVSLYDIDRESAELNLRFASWLKSRPEAVSAWNYELADSLDSCLSGADAVVISIQPGPFSLMESEIAAADRYGRFFSVGDSVGAAGYARGLRSAVIFEDFAHRIMSVCPDAWVVNFTNPLSICTRALYAAEPGIKAIGCCHEAARARTAITELARKKFGLSREEEPGEAEIDLSGINHFEWILSASFAGHDLFPALSEKVEDGMVLRPYSKEEVVLWGNAFVSGERVKFSLFKEFGAFPAAGDRHLVEFLPGIVSSEASLYSWGVARTPVSYRVKTWSEAPARTLSIMSGLEPFEVRPSGEEGSTILMALLGGAPVVATANLPNSGQAPGLQESAIVETLARFSRDSARPIVSGKLPRSIEALVRIHIANQETIVASALSRDYGASFPAFLLDPATSLPPDECARLFGELLEIGKPFLPPREAVRR